MNIIKAKVTRNPVVVYAIVTGLVMAVSLGWIDLNREQLESIEGFLTVAVPLFGAVLPVAMSWFARRKVTPMDDPRTANGEDAMIVKRQ